MGGSRRATPLRSATVPSQATCTGGTDRQSGSSPSRIANCWPEWPAGSAANEQHFRIRAGNRGPEAGSALPAVRDLGPVDWYFLTELGVVVVGLPEIVRQRWKSNCSSAAAVPCSSGFLREVDRRGTIRSLEFIGQDVMPVLKDVMLQ